MKARPILFSAPMIKALLAGTKTQTRRTLKPCKDRDFGCDLAPHEIAGEVGQGRYRNCLYGAPGDLLSVKEAVYLWCERRPNGTTPSGRPKWLYVPMREAPIHYAADGPKPTTDIVSPDTGNVWMWKHKVARFMPRWASRLTLRITDVRVQLLQEISEADARSEGIEQCEGGAFDYALQLWAQGMSPRGSFLTLWQSINGADSWDANPYVWALTFEVIKANVDTVLP